MAYRKYKAKKVTVDGETFDSKKEYKRWLELKELERVGEISHLQRQVKFILIPAQREPDTIGKRGGIHKGKLLERECAYYADFVYLLKTDVYKTIVEDSKGFKTPEYKIKKKLMLYRFGIQIKET